jgi:hypothetical protein
MPRAGRTRRRFCLALLGNRATRGGGASVDASQVAVGESDEHSREHVLEDWGFVLTPLQPGFLKSDSGRHEHTVTLGVSQGVQATEPPRTPPRAPEAVAAGRSPASRSLRRARLSEFELVPRRWLVRYLCEGRESRGCGEGHDEPGQAHGSEMP